MIFRDFVLKDPLLRFFHTLSDGYKLYAVGGIVRDYLLGRKSLDYDIVVVGNFRDIVDAFLKKFGGRLVQITEFGTAKIKVDHRIVDIARARKEVYPKPGSLPSVLPSNNILEDLRRRDFTINAMAISLNMSDVGRLIDPFGGYEDLFENRLLRVIKEKSYYEDPTRAFRGIRYKNRFNLSYHPLILQSEIPLALKVLPQVSFARIKHELERIAEEENRVSMFKEVKEFHLLDHLGQPVEADGFDRLEDVLEEKDASQWVLFSLLIVKLSSDLPDLRKRERSLIKGFNEFLDRHIPEDPFEIHRIFYNMDPEIPLLIGILKRREDLVSYYVARKRIRIHLKGELLVNSGLRNENIRNFLIELFVKKWMGEIRTEGDEVRFLKKWTS